MQSSHSCPTLDFIGEELPATTKKPAEIMRPAVFFDVDGTLTPVKVYKKIPKEKRRHLSRAALQVCKDQGIKDIFIFTNMDLGTLQTEHKQKLINANVSEEEREIWLSRKEIVAELENQGFIVHQVLMPADIGYNKGPGACYRDFYLKHQQRIDNQSLKMAVSGEGAYTHCDFEEDTLYAEDRKLLSDFKNIAKDALSIFCEKHPDEMEAANCTNIKVILLDYALRFKPAWLSSVIVFDDEESVVHSLKAASIIFNKFHNVPLHVIKVEDDCNKLTYPFIVDDAESLKTYYHELRVIRALKTPDDQEQVLHGTLLAFRHYLAQSKLTKQFPKINSIYLRLCSDMDEKMSPYDIVLRLKSICNSELSRVQKFGLLFKASNSESYTNIINYINDMDVRDPGQCTADLIPLIKKSPRSSRSSMNLNATE